MNSSFPVKSASGIIRLASESDIPFIYAMYGPYIEKTAVTFETELPGIVEFSARLTNIMDQFPFLVYENLEGKVLGYAYAAKYRERKAYQWCLESSIYLDKSCFGLGIGVELYSQLISLCRNLGYTRLYGVITTPNAQSESFHKKLGFQKFAVYEKTGFKLGQWWDVAWYELVLNEAKDSPALPMKVKDYLNTV